MTAPVIPGAVGTPLARIEAVEKVTGQARYAFEHAPDRRRVLQPGPGHDRPRRDPRPRRRGGARAPRRARGRLGRQRARAGRPGGDAELALFQTREVAYRGQIVAAVVADTLEGAREAAGLVTVAYDEQPHDVVLRADHPEIYTPEKVNPSFPSETGKGDLDGALGLRRRVGRRARTRRPPSTTTRWSRTPRSPSGTPTAG